MSRRTIRSVLVGRSACPVCGTPLTRRNLIPLLSWLVQRGRCHHCGTRISILYPLLEIASGLCFVLGGRLAVGAVGGLSISEIGRIGGIGGIEMLMTYRPLILWRCFVLWAMLLLIVTDLQHMELHLIATGLLYLLLLSGVRQGYLSPLASVIQRGVWFGLAFGAVYLLAMGYVYLRYRQPWTPGMGLGDVIVAPALGILLTMPSHDRIQTTQHIAWFVILAAVISLILAGIRYLMGHRDGHVPFLPGLCVSCIVLLHF